MSPDPGQPHCAARMFCTDYVGTLIFDVGSVTTRAGFAGEDMPRAVYPSSVCAWLTEPNDDGEPERRCGVLESDKYMNAETLARVQARRVLPSRSVGVDEWVLRQLLDHGLRGLGCQSWTEHPVLLTEPTWADAASRRRKAELMFEEVGVPALCIARSAELVAIGSSRPTAVVVEVGGDAASATVVADGMALTRSISQAQMAGGVALARLVAQAVSQRSGPLTPLCSLRTTCDTSLCALRIDELARDMLESACHCTERQQAGSKGRATGPPKPQPVASYILPDGRVIELGEERTTVAESLFTPTVLRGAAEVTRLESPPLHEA